MRLKIETRLYPTHTPLKITRGTLVEARAVAVTLEADGIIGRGEGVGVAYLGESVESMTAQLEAARKGIERGLSRAQAAQILPSGGARNALDSALWDIDAKRSGVRAWTLAGTSPGQAVGVVATIGLEAPEAAERQALQAPPHAALKIKLGHAADDLERVRRIRAAQPGSRLIADANEGWTFEELSELAPALAALGVEMIEQPLPRGLDGALEGWKSPVPLCADESCQDRSDLGDVARRYAMINIKLDKTGGLTEALALADAARAQGLPYMMGCMLESSLGLAPAFVLAGGAVWCDLDGPRYIIDDCEPKLVYRNGWLEAPLPALWG